MRSLPRSILSRQVQSERSLVNDRCDEISSKYGYSGFSEKSDKPLGSGVLRKERNLYRSGLLMSQRIDGLYPPRETSELLEASRLLPVGLKCLAQRLLQ